MNSSQKYLKELTHKLSALGNDSGKHIYSDFIIEAGPVEHTYDLR